MSRPKEGIFPRLASPVSPRSSLATSEIDCRSHRVRASCGFCAGPGRWRLILLFLTGTLLAGLGLPGGGLLGLLGLAGLLRLLAGLLLFPGPLLRGLGLAGGGRLGLLLLALGYPP